MKMKPRIALFMNHPECSRQCVNGMIEALKDDYKILIVSNKFFTRDNLRDVDIVAFPGGIIPFSSESMEMLSRILLNPVGTILEYVWGLIGLVLIILIF